MELEYTEVQYKITKNCEKYKKAYDKVEKYGVDEQFMKCENCGIRQPWTYDHKGRIIIEN